MSSENSECPSSLTLQVKGETRGNRTLFPRQLTIGDARCGPRPIQRPAIKKDLSLLGLSTTEKPFLPGWTRSDWESLQGVPGHFVQVANSPSAPLHPWHGPNIMGALTRLHDVFRYIKESLGAYWTEWVELHITGFSPLHFPPRPVWRRIEAFHVHISSHLADCDGLGAVRGEAMYRDRVLDAPYLQVIIRIRPPRLRWLAQLHLFEIISVPSRFEWNLRRLRAGANSHYGL